MRGAACGGLEQRVAQTDGRGGGGEVDGYGGVADPAHSGRAEVAVAGGQQAAASISFGVKRDRASCKRSKHRENRTKEAAASASTPTASKHSGWCGRGASLPSSFFLVPLLFCKPYSS